MNEFRTERIYEDGEWLEKPAMTLPNGAKLVFLRYHRDMLADFRYSDSEITFDFTASRWGEGEDGPKDYWEVRSGLR